MGTARELYTAETFWAGYYDLYEINEEIFSKLKPKGMERRDAHELINTGRHLYKSVSDRNGSYDVALDENYASREISYDEFRSFFPTLTGCFSGGATFAADTGELLHFEGWLSDEEMYITNEAGEQVRVTGGAGQLHICMSKEGLPVTDVIVSGNESYTEVDGVPLKTGYFVTKPNSRGKRTAIFFAEYTRNGTTVYAELSGDQSESGQIGERLTEAVYGMITKGSPDLSAARY